MALSNCVVISPAFAAPGAASADGVVFIYVDDQFVAAAGGWPISRLYYAKLLDKLASAGSKAAILKFYFDLDGPGTTELANAMSKIPVYLQLTLKPGMGGGAPNFRSLEKSASNSTVTFPNNILSAADVVLPVPELLKRAAGMGFVEHRNVDDDSRIEAFARVDGKLLPSLVVVAAETYHGVKSTVTGNNLAFRSKVFELDEMGRIKCAMDFGTEQNVFTITQLMSNKVLGKRLANKLVIIGYGRGDSPTKKIKSGQDVPIHKYFFHEVKCLTR